MPNRANAISYDEDVLLWSEQQAALLRAGDVGALDLEHLAEEIESVGSSQRHEVRRRLARLLQHLLKWRYQPVLQSPSWRATIRVQRIDLQSLLDDSPSMRGRMPELLVGGYRLGRGWAEIETGLPTLPETCPFTIDQILAEDWLPE